MLWSTELLFLRHVVPDASRLLLRRRPNSQRLLRRGTLLAELDRTSHHCPMPKLQGRGELENAMLNKEESVQGVGIAAPETVKAQYSSASSYQGETYLVPSHYAKKLEGVPLSASTPAVAASSTRDPLYFPRSSLSASFSTDVNFSPTGGGEKGEQISSLEGLGAQHAALREMFQGAERRCIRLRKDRAWLWEERRAFRVSHRRAPTEKEVSPFVDVALTPVAALKLAKHLSPHSSSREMVKHSILLQHIITTNKLVQVGEKTLFRCLRCFHVYAARPRTLLKDKVGHSWLEYEAERKRVNKARESTRHTGFRKNCSVGRRREAFVDNPHCCPGCGSSKAQWMMEYVHHSTHG